MSPEKRISKKQIKQDNFITTALKASEFIQKQKKYFYGGVAGIIVIILIAYFVSYTNTQKLANSENMFGKAQLAAAMGQNALAINDYRSVLDEFGSTPIADRACYFLARTYFDQQNYDSAMVYFNVYIDEYAKEPLFVVGAYAGAAECYKNQEDYAKAGEYYIKAAQQADNDYESPDFYMAAGRVYRDGGMFTEAAGAYQQVVDNYNRSMQFSLAKKYLAEVKYAPESE